MTWLDPSIVVDPFTFAALIGIAAWLNRRLSKVENIVAYNRGYLAGEQTRKGVKD
jgi:hypothetical protein